MSLNRFNTTTYAGTVAAGQTEVLIGPLDQDAESGYEVVAVWIATADGGPAHAQLKIGDLVVLQTGATTLDAVGGGFLGVQQGLSVVAGSGSGSVNYSVTVRRF